MSFTVNISSMELFLARLNAQPRLSPVQELFRDSLVRMCSEAAVLDSVVSKDSPFYAEFFTALPRLAVDNDSCFALFECVTLFVREKALRVGSGGLSLEERSILTFFEKSGQWQRGDGTLVSEWYFSVLPEKYALYPLLQGFELPDMRRESI